VQRPRSIILLIIWFLWASGKDLDGLARYTTTVDYYIFESIGASWLYFLVAGAVFLINVCVVFYLFRPHAVGYTLALIALGAAALQNVVATAIAVNDIPGVRKAYEIGRELRGLPVREEASDMIFSPSALWLSVGLATLVYGAIALIVRRNRAFFTGPLGYVAEA
jgi:hypothetical protein